MSARFQIYRFGYSFMLATGFIFMEGKKLFYVLNKNEIKYFDHLSAICHRSPHGFADIDMPTMCQQLQREEDNLCAQRGLVQGTDTQTFSIFFHQNLLDKWRKLQSSTISSQVNFWLCTIFCINQFFFSFWAILFQSNGVNTVVNALNQFLTSFLDHVSL